MKILLSSSYDALHSKLITLFVIGTVKFERFILYHRLDQNFYAKCLHINFFQPNAC